MRNHRRTGVAAMAIAGALLVTACGDDSDTSGGATTATGGAETTAGGAETTAGGAETTAAGGAETTATGGAETTAGGGVSLAGICPDPVIIQKDWWPEAEHGATYRLLGDEYTVDTDAKRVSGPLVDADGNPTGVDVEIRMGGGATGFQQVTSLLYQDPDILLGYITTDEAIQNSADNPTIAVVAPLDKNPQIIFWDPATYPDIETIADLGAANVKIQYFSPATYMEGYLIGEGIVKKENTDGSYDGTPANFVAAEGKIASQGFGSAEPYIYENEIPEWGKPIAYQYIHDTGWQPYSQTLATTPENLEKYGDCFEALVPIVQQAIVDYIDDPAPTNAIILDAVKQFESSAGWVYSQGVADFSVEAQLNDELVSNGTNDTVGDFDEARIDDLIAKAAPIFEQQGKPVKEGLTAADVATNEFIDQSIGL